MPALNAEVARTLIPSPAVAGEGGEPKRAGRALYKSGTISNATMLMILIMGLIAGPAVSL